MSKDLKDRKEEIEALVKKVQAGDKEAFTPLYDIYADPLYRYIYYKVNRGDAEDILETVFLKVWENFSSFDSKKGNFTSWIYRIAHNLIVDYYRASSKRETMELDVNLKDEKRSHNPIDVTESVLNSETLKLSLDKLKPRYRDILIYKFINQLDNKEISQLINQSEGSVRILQFRALKALRKVLEKKGIKYGNIL